MHICDKQKMVVLGNSGKEVEDKECFDFSIIMEI